MTVVRESAAILEVEAGELSERGLQVFVGRLAAYPRSRIGMSDLWAALAEAFPRRPTGAAERAWLLAALQHASGQGVIELPREGKSVTIEKGQPICRVMPVRRDTYFAKQMSPAEFDDFFARGQRWLATHGRVEHEAAAARVKGRAKARPPKATGGSVVDITRTYVRQQVRSKFVVME